MIINKNLKNLNWKDGWGAAGFGAVAASATTSGVMHVKNQPHRLKQVRWNKFKRALIIKTEVDKKTISKKFGAEMCVEIGVDPQFLDNKAFQEISSDTKSAPNDSKLASSDSTKPPMASISFSNSKTMPYYRKKATTNFWDDTKRDFSSRNSCECCDNIQSQRPMEYAQVAEVTIPNSSGSSISIAKQRNLIPIWGVVFIISTGLYLIVLSKLKNNPWYNKNFDSDQFREDWYQKNFDRSYEKLEKLTENQKKILENQNQILELLKKNSFINKE